MAGYKTTIKNDNPVSFHTFDLDSQSLHNSSIIDEMNSNANPMTLFGSNYELEYVSQNPIETSNQASILYAPNGKQNDIWSPIYGVINHNSDYTLNEWSMEFLINKSLDNEIFNIGEPAYNIYKNTPIIYKGTAIKIYFREHKYNADYLIVDVLNSEFNISVLNSTRHPIFNQSTHIAVTYNVTQTDVNEYTVILTVYINGRVAGSDTNNYFDSPPTMISGDSIYVMGNGGSNSVTDFVTAHTALDQLAIYNYPLTDEQISNHYHKTKTYENLISLDYPSFYWRMNDTSSIDDIMYNTIGGLNGSYYGEVIKNQEGVSTIHDSISTKFNNPNGTAIVAQDHIMNTGLDYTVEFWFKVNQGARGMLLSCHEEIHNYRGLTIFCNSRNDGEWNGMIQVNEGENYRLLSEEGVLYNDGNWHHLAVIRSGNTLSLVIDADIVSELSASPQGTNGDTSQLHLMAIDPGLLSVNGSLSEVALYNEALQLMQLNSHYHFSTRYKIFGYTLLEGQGTSAKVRFYDTITGEKVGETQSDYTGEYNFYTYSNKQLDVMALLPDNVTTRYRVHAPVVPSEFDDSHI